MDYKGCLFWFLFSFPSNKSSDKIDIGRLSCKEDLYFHNTGENVIWSRLLMDCGLPHTETNHKTLPCAYSGELISDIEVAEAKQHK